jgi:VWFA-related protein
MTRRLRLFIVVLLAAVVFASHALAAQDAERHVYVTVVDKDGTPITGLTPDFFAVREDGRDRTVLRVAPLDTPMHVAIILDTSFGPTVPIDAFRSAVGDFIERLAAFHNVAVYSVTERPTRVADYSRDAAKLRSSVASLFARPDSRTYLIDTIELALRDMQPLEPARPVIVAFTTETVEASTRTAGAVIKQLIERSTMLHAITLNTLSGGTTAPFGRDPGNVGIPGRSAQLGRVNTMGEGDRERNRLLEQGTTVTAGTLQNINSVTALAGTLFKLASEFAYSYRVTFARPPSGKPLKDLQVGVLADGVSVRAIGAPGTGKK